MIEASALCDEPLENASGGISGTVPQRARRQDDAPPVSTVTGGTQLCPSHLFCLATECELSCLTGFHPRLLTMYT